MYAGHFAIGLAIKARSPKIPSLPILLGIGFLDVMDGLFILLGLNTVTPNPQAGPYLYFDLSFIDWDHSLLAALFWSALWGALFMKDCKVAWIAALACFSHFVLDWPMHNNDLALYPYSAEHLGLGLWGRLGNLSWVLEGVLAALLMLYAWRENAKRGVASRWPAVLLAILFLQLSPWTSPLKFIALADEPLRHWLQGGLVLSGFLLPGLLFVWLLDRAERRA